MGKGNSNNQQQFAQTQMNTSAQAAAQKSPYEQEMNDYYHKLFKLYSGEEKFDLSKVPGIGTDTKLYEMAKAKTDRGRKGRGLMLGGGENGTGYNANLMGAIDQQNQDERERDAAGQVEANVSERLQSAVPGLRYGNEVDQSRRDSSANRWAGIYGAEINKPQQPKWWQSLLTGVATAATGPLIGKI